MNVDTQLLLSVEEAADVIGLGRTRTYELVMAKKIQSVKVGRRRLVVRSSLAACVARIHADAEAAMSETGGSSNRAWTERSPAACRRSNHRPSSKIVK